MAEQLYYTLVTDYGLGAMQNASFLQQQVELTHLAIGDGNGTLYEPQGSQKTLKNEVYRGQLNHVYADPDNPAMMVFECVIPQTSGGYTIREAGLFDADGNLFAIAKVAETVKPKLEEGAAKELYIRLILELSNTEAITIKIDPSIVLATQKWTAELFTPIEHVSDFNNPHKVTAEQVGAPTTTTVNNHINNRDNPHKVTINQAIAAAGGQEHQYKIPKGGIIMWSGATNQIPTGWALCNGQNSTPDLRNRFVIGAGGAYAVGATGGAIDKTSTSGGAHAHSFSKTTSSSGVHKHKVNFWSNNHTLSIAQIPSHYHGFATAGFDINGGGSSGTNRLDFGDNAPFNGGTRNMSTGGGGGHRHLLDGASHDAGAHAHTVSGNTNNTGAHTHKVNVLPPYYALAFIMKL